MKKLIGLTAIVLLFSLTINAQQRDGRMNKKADFTPEQMATLQSKKMALNLDLNENQQKAIYDLNLKNAKEQETRRAKFREQKQGSSLSSDEKFKLANDRIERQLAHKNAMKKILTENQYAKWEKTSKNKMRDGNRKMGKERGMRKGNSK